MLLKIDLFFPPPFFHSSSAKCSGVKHPVLEHFKWQTKAFVVFYISGVNGFIIKQACRLFIIVTSPCSHYGLLRNDLRF